MDRRLLPMLMGLLLAGLAGSSRSADAQDTSSPPTGGTANDRSSQTSPQRTILKQDDNGQWHPVPLDDAAFDEFTPDRTAGATVEPTIPDYFLSKLLLAGTAAADSVTLTADVTVEVVADNRWLRVPLRFDQGLLLDLEHQGVGEAALDPVRSANQGISWLLRGRGQHRLRLSLRVPVRKTPEGDQFQLQLPTLEYFTGTLELRIPSSSVTIREGDAIKLRGTKTVENATVISADLRGERLDLRWSVIEQPLEPIIQQPTEITLRLLENLAELLVHQEIQFRSGQRNYVRVRLPSGGYERSPRGVRLRDESGTDRWVQPIPDEASWVKVPLAGVVGNLVKLDWQLTQRLDGSGDGIVIDGFDVAEARSHTGTISVQDRHGYRVSRIDDGDVWIKRIDVDQRLASLAYAFSGGPYRLQLNVEPVAPSFSVTPYYFLMVYQDRVILEAAFQINVDEGSVRNVPIRWRQSPEMTWTVSASSLNSGELRAVPADAGAEATTERQWILQLPQLVDRSTVAGLSGAYFSLDEFQETASFSLPTVVGARAFPGWVIVSTDDNVEVTTRPTAGTRLTLQADSALDERPISLPDWADAQPRSVYRLTTANADADPQLEHEVTVRTQKTKTSAIVELRDLERRLRISQRIAYSVAFGRLSRIRLQIPPTLGPLIQDRFRDQFLRFSLDGEIPLVANWSGRNVVIDLPAPRLGDFEIVVEDYPLEETHESDEGLLAIPIIGSRDQPYDTVRLSVPHQETLAVTVSDPQWTRLTTVAEGRQWITDQVVEDVPLIVDRSFAKSPLRLTIGGALLQTEVDDAGTRLTTATYLLERPVNRLVVQLPADAANPRFVWNGSELSAAEAVEDANSPGEFRLTLPSAGSAGAPFMQRLRIRSHQPPGPSRWGQSRPVDFPVFPSGVWIEQTWWELTLPHSQHLFVPPATMSPQFHWERELAFWKRQPNAEFLEIKSRILGDSFSDARPSHSSGNAYAFTSLGSREQVRFSSLSNSMIVFLGAGFTLTLSFLLMKVPAARHPLLWLAVGLSLTAASLWYLEPMLLLLQPAVYGLVLPVCAALLEYVTNGRRPVTGLSQPFFSQRERLRDSGSGFAAQGAIEPERTTAHLRSSAISDSGIQS